MGKPEDTRNRIIMSAVKLAKEEGPEHVSVKQICDKADVSKNTFYTYFHSRDEVFGETYSTSEEQKMVDLPNIMLTYDSPLEQFWELNKIDIARHESFGPKLLATITSQNVRQASFNIESEETLPPSIKMSLALIKKMQRMGEIKNMADPFDLLRAMYSAAIGIDIRWTMKDAAFDFKREYFNLMCAIIEPTIEISNY